MVHYNKQNGSTNSPSRSRATDTNKSKSSGKSGGVKPNGSTNSPGRGKK